MVCNYNPAGNVRSEYRDNVLPVTSKQYVSELQEWLATMSGKDKKRYSFDNDPLSMADIDDLGDDVDDEDNKTQSQKNSNVNVSLDQKSMQTMNSVEERQLNTGSPHPPPRLPGHQNIFDLTQESEHSFSDKSFAEMVPGLKDTSMVVEEEEISTEMKDFIYKIYLEHNEYRKQHYVNALVLSPTLCVEAQKWARVSDFMDIVK